MKPDAHTLFFAFKSAVFYAKNGEQTPFLTFFRTVAAFRRRKIDDEKAKESLKSQARLLDNDYSLFYNNSRTRKDNNRT